MKTLTPGVTYNVLIEDCCVSGEFTSVLDRIFSEDGDDDYPTLYFANGVELSWYIGCKIREA